MRISEWSSDVCSADRKPDDSTFGAQGAEIEPFAIDGQVFNSFFTDREGQPRSRALGRRRAENLEGEHGVRIGRVERVECYHGIREALTRRRHELVQYSLVGSNREAEQIESEHI